MAATIEKVYSKLKSVDEKLDAIMDGVVLDTEPLSPKEKADLKTTLEEVRNGTASTWDDLKKELDL